MTKKSLIESLRQNMPQGLNEIETARYVYIELGKIKSFDIKHYYGNAETKRKIYRLAQETNHNTERVADKRTIICVSLSYLYRDVLKALGIKCGTLLDEEDPDKHVRPIVRLSDGSLLEADLQMDLHKIQTRCKTRYFRMADFGFYEKEQLSDEELKAIDRKIGYIQDDYKDKDLEQIRQETAHMNANERLKVILNDPRIFQNPDLKGYVEVQKYYYSVLNRVANEQWEGKIHMLDCYRKDANQSRDYTLCVFSAEKDEACVYLYSFKEGRFISTSMEKMIELQEKGLTIGRHERQNGVHLLKKYMKIYQKKEQKNPDEKRSNGEER